MFDRCKQHGVTKVGPCPFFVENLLICRISLILNAHMRKTNLLVSLQVIKTRLVIRKTGQYSQYSKYLAGVLASQPVIFGLAKHVCNAVVFLQCSTVPNRFGRTRVRATSSAATSLISSESFPTPASTWPCMRSVCISWNTCISSVCLTFHNCEFNAILFSHSSANT